MGRATSATSPAVNSRLLRLPQLVWKQIYSPARKVVVHRSLPLSRPNALLYSVTFQQQLTSSPLQPPVAPEVIPISSLVCITGSLDREVEMSRAEFSNLEVSWQSSPPNSSWTPGEPIPSPSPQATLDPRRASPPKLWFSEALLLSFGTGRVAGTGIAAPSPPLDSPFSPRAPSCSAFCGTGDITPVGGVAIQGESGADDATAGGEASIPPTESSPSAASEEGNGRGISAGSKGRAAVIKANEDAGRGISVRSKVNGTKKNGDNGKGVSVGSKVKAVVTRANGPAPALEGSSTFQMRFEQAGEDLKHTAMDGRRGKGRV